MVGSCGLLAIPTLLCATATTFPALLVWRGLQGLLIPGVTAISVAWIGDEAPGTDLGRKVGLLIAASVAGGLVGRVGSGLVATFFGWRAPFVLFGLLTLAGAAAMAMTFPVPSRRPHEDVRTGGALRHLRSRRLVGAFLVGGSVFFGFIGIFTFLPYHLTAAPYRLGTAAISSVYLVYVFGILTSLLTEPFARRHGERLVIAAGFAIASVGALGTQLPSVTGVVLALVVLCVGMFAVQSTAPAYVNRNAEGAKGAASALYVSFYYVGATLGAFLPGHAYQRWGWSGVVATCLGSFGVGLAADWFLCRDSPTAIRTQA